MTEPLPPSKGIRRSPQGKAIDQGKAVAHSTAASCTATAAAAATSAKRGSILMVIAKAKAAEEAQVEAAGATIVAAEGTATANRHEEVDEDMKPQLTECAMPRALSATPAVRKGAPVTAKVATRHNKRAPPSSSSAAKAPKRAAAGLAGLAGTMKTLGSFWSLTMPAAP